ncbi:MAG: DNA primase [Gammaproteobacteria bacterium]|nr:DNA primase [Gammaproteobacteria bacterium]MDH5799676.1 DNA primase [Gammaproteobacteria bacterium]
MAGKIPQQFIDNLLIRTDIVEVINSRVALKKAGREYTACCPFHNEKTPSFTVSPDKQFYYCFGCGANGSAIGFLMEYDHMGFVDAVEDLASRVGMTVPTESLPDTRKPDVHIYKILGKTETYFKYQLKHSEHAATAVDYLKRRGLSGVIAQEYGIGFAPPGWDNLLNAFAQKGTLPEHLEKAGLLIAKDSGSYYDRFRHRIMFPIRDQRGRTIAFGGRVMGDETPKYLNSPETSVFHKNRELYGLYESRKAVRDLTQIIVVEGYMDVVSLAQFGIRNAVATLGTATSQEHLERIFRIVPEVVFCFDGDRAGKKAAWRALTQSLPIIREGRQIKFLFLPEGEDPDSLVRKEGTEQFQHRMDQAVPFSSFFFNTMAKGVNLSTLDGRSMIVERAKPLLTKIQPGVFLQMMLAKLAEIIHMDSEKLSTLIFPTQYKKQPVVPAKTKNGGLSPVRHAIRLLLEKPQLAHSVDLTQINGLHTRGVDLLCRIAELAQNNPELSCGALLEHWRGTTEGGHLAKLINIPLQLSENEVEREFADTFNKLIKWREDQRLDEILEKSRFEQVSEADKQELKKALTEKH